MRKYLLFKTKQSKQTNSTQGPVCETQGFLDLWICLWHILLPVIIWTNSKLTNERLARSQQGLIWQLVNYTLRVYREYSLYNVKAGIKNISLKNWTQSGDNTYAMLFYVFWVSMALAKMVQIQIKNARGHLQVQCICK